MGTMCPKESGTVYDFLLWTERQGIKCFSLFIYFSFFKNNDHYLLDALWIELIECLLIYFAWGLKISTRSIPSSLTLFHKGESFLEPHLSLFPPFDSKMNQQISKWRKHMMMITNSHSPRQCFGPDEFWSLLTCHKIRFSTSCHVITCWVLWS